eukprot:4598308-Alexandrium_andersonii.AAC.1
MSASLVGSEMCIRDRANKRPSFSRAAADCARGARCAWSLLRMGSEGRRVFAALAHRSRSGFSKVTAVCDASVECSQSALGLRGAQRGPRGLSELFGWSVDVVGILEAGHLGPVLGGLRGQPLFQAGHRGAGRASTRGSA